MDLGPISAGRVHDRRTVPEGTVGQLLEPTILDERARGRSMELHVAHAPETTSIEDHDADDNEQASGPRDHVHAGGGEEGHEREEPLQDTL